MFTLKFYMHDTDSHEAFSCERYSVSIERTSNTEVGPTVIRMFRTLGDDNPYYETVGPQEPYGHVFIMNEQGKTIDTLQ